MIKTIIKLLVLVVLVSLFVNIAYGADFSVMNHDSNSSYDNQTIWVANNGTTNITLSFTNNNSSADNITTINIKTSIPSPITSMSNITCPTGWYDNSSSGTDITCKSNTSLLQPGETAYINATVSSNYVAEYTKDKWIWTTYDSASDLDFNNFWLGVDVWGPEIILVWPQNNSEIKSGSIIQFNVTDPAGVDSVWYSVNGGANNTTMSSPYNINTTNWTGSVNLKIWANDSLGNLGENITNLSGNELTIIIDDESPNLVTINNPIADSWYGDSITVNVTVEDNNTVADVVAIINGTATNLTENSGFWTGVVNSSTLAQGNHTLAINASDIAGNYNDSESVNVQIDKTNPDITITLPTLNSNLNSGAQATFRASVNDSESGVASTCSVEIASVNLGTVPYNNVSGLCDGILTVSSSVPLGSQTLTMTIQDTAGNENSSSIAVDITSNTNNGGGGGRSSGGYTPVAKIVTENTIPTITAPRVDNEVIFIGDTVKCLPGEFNDEDGDTKIGDKWQWYMNGQVIAGKNKDYLVIDSSFKSGDRISCAESATDGIDYSSWVKSSNRATVQQKPVVVQGTKEVIEEDQPAPRASPFTGAFLGGALEDDTLNMLIIITFFGIIGGVAMLRHLDINRRIHFKVK